MVGDGKYASVEDAVSHIIKVSGGIEPNPDKKDYYDRKYCVFKKLHHALKNL